MEKSPRPENLGKIKEINPGKSPESEEDRKRREFDEAAERIAKINKEGEEEDLDRQAEANKNLRELTDDK